MDSFFTPNLAYLALLGGVMMGMMAFVVPGTGLMEVLTIFLVGIAGYGLMQFGSRTWALLLILPAILAIYATYRHPRRWPRLAGNFLLALGFGLLYPHTRLGIVISGSIIFSLMMVFIHTQFQAIETIQATTPLDTVVGQIGEARSEIHHEGSVYVGGQLWSARSKTPIPAGTTVRVLDVKGITLIVEPISPSAATS